jgi:outer membrane immunogenic protein
MLKRLSSTLLAATAIGLILAGSASAADLRAPVKAPPPALPPPVQDWSGIYVGVEGGYGWGKQNNGLTAPFTLDPDQGEFNAQAGLPPFFTSEFDEFHQALIFNRHGVNASVGGMNTSGWLFGAFFGAQKQWGNWVLGIEGGVDGADISGSTSGFASFHNDCVTGNLCSQLGDSDGHVIDLRHTLSLETKIDMIADLKGKIGYAWSPNWMVYGLGGAAWAHVKNSLNSFQSVDFGDDCEGAATIAQCAGQSDEISHFARTFTASGDQTMLGFTLGAGIDYKWQVDPGSAVVFGLVYQYYNFPSQTFTFTSPNSGLSSAFTSSETVNVIKGRISYLFSIH